VAGFVGRSKELKALRRHLRSLDDRDGGVFLSVRGRRQVGKSRLVEEFLRTAAVPAVFFSAAKGESRAEEIRAFAAEVTESSLEAAPLFRDATFDRWEPALRLLASNLSKPSVVVMDELPFLFGGDPALEGALQRVWDRHLSRVPILLIAIGSDVSTMEMLGRYDRPLYQRMREMVVEPFTPAETAQMLEAEAAAALDAQLVVGGFPTLVHSWHGARTLEHFLRVQLADSTSPLVVVGERIVTAEFPRRLEAGNVLHAIGAGETGFTAIATRAGINQGSLKRSLDVLIRDKRVVAVERPLSARSSRNARYYVADPYLRFWLRFVAPNMELVLRGRGDVLTSRIAERWSDYRGRAIEPLVRAAIERMLPRLTLGEARHVGSYWTRTGDVEVDLVGGKDADPPTPVSFVGSIKWRERSPFNRRDLAQLAAARARVPGADHALLVGVSRSGFATDELDLALGPDDLLAAWS